jgi:hypothetical protein
VEKTVPKVEKHFRNWIKCSKLRKNGLETREDTTFLNIFSGILFKNLSIIPEPGTIPDPRMNPVGERALGTAFNHLDGYYYYYIKDEILKKELN